MAWTSLVDRRDFLRDKMLWQIRNGENVDIWQEKWVPGLKVKCLENPGLIGESLLQKVVEIIEK